MKLINRRKRGVLLRGSGIMMSGSVVGIGGSTIGVHRKPPVDNFCNTQIIRIYSTSMSVYKNHENSAKVLMIFLP